MNRMRGFTLIELSIVLVIIGLIVGGVLVGRDLIRAAAIRAEVSQFEKYITSVHTFRTKYDCIPGDCIHATRFLGTTAPNGNTVYNGNGDGFVNIANQVNDTAPYSAPSEEYLNFFPHLGLANLVEGTYSNIASATAAFPTNMPLDKIGRAGIIGTSLEPITASGSGFGYTGSKNEWMLFYPAAYKMTSGNVYYLTGGGNVLTPGEAYQIDAKIDDRIPGRGRVQGVDYNGPFLFGGATENCLSDTNYNSSTTYNLAAAKINIVSCVMDIGWEALQSGIF